MLAQAVRNAGVSGGQTHRRSEAASRLDVVFEGGYLCSAAVVEKAMVHVVKTRDGSERRERKGAGEGSVAHDPDISGECSSAGRGQGWYF